ncbi:probable E3 ubiquitin-protein ligase ATL44 [Hordeum vulgare subsp. vulgare]|uniref:RING-type E3 ubiquitin transferase n=1 Tax=Hordeum vulgare subsp. vulgare TaxID=112509 RepID=A0A8I6Z9E1_HORVV|nr:probable E3 ubiquitin-protein ligase ATL44 [Hordeum vulgare subsp. vulgare]
MRAPARVLHRAAALTAAGTTETSSSPASPQQPTEQAAPMAVDSDMTVILASLLCAVVCVLGLALASRCACRRRSSSSTSSSDAPPKGLKKKAIDALPTVSFAAAAASPQPAATECAICLAEFAEGEGVRVLPRCGHAFHALCIDAWLRTCATCPSCRASIVAAPAPTVVVVVAGNNRCGRCGEAPAPAGDGDDITFLP